MKPMKPILWCLLLTAAIASMSSPALAHPHHPGPHPGGWHHPGPHPGGWHPPGPYPGGWHPPGPQRPIYFPIPIPIPLPPPQIYPPPEVRAENYYIHQQMGQLRNELQVLGSEMPTPFTAQRIQQVTNQLGGLQQRDNQIHAMYGSFGPPPY